MSMVSDERTWPPAFLLAQGQPVSIDDDLERRLLRNRLLPLAYVALSREGRLHELGEARRHRWRHAWRVALTQNLATMAEVLHLGRCLASQGRSVVLLKGAALLLTMYDDAGMRPMQDVDLLVASEDLEVVGAVLEARGFHLLREGHAARRDAVIGRFVYRGPGMAIELHTRLEWALLALDSDAMRARAISPSTRSLAIPGGCEGLRILTVEDALLYALVHWVVHWRSHTYDIWPWELSQGILHAPPDWSRVVAEARRHGIEPCVHHALAALHSEWLAPVPGEVRRALRPGPLLRLLTHATRGNVRLQVLVLLNPVRFVFPTRARWVGRGAGSHGFVRSYVRYLRDLLGRGLDLLRGRV